MKLEKLMGTSQVVPFDTLAYAKKLESRGIEFKHAEAHAEVLAEILENHFPTKRETNAVINDFSQQIDRLDQKIDRKFNELDQKIDRKFNELDQKIDTLRHDMETEFVIVRKEMDAGFAKQKWGILTWVFGIAFTQTALTMSVMFSMFKFFH